MKIETIESRSRSLLDLEAYSITRSLVNCEIAYNLLE